MSESSDYSAGSWSGYDYSSQRKAYENKKATVDYSTPSTPRGTSAGSAILAKAELLLPKTIATQSPSPLVIQVDNTGSMGTWPAVIFGKLPYFDNELRTEYLGEDYEVSFGCIGDAHNGENFPLQVCAFAKGTDLKERLDSLEIEAMGGGQTKETYELGALWYARNCAMPKAVRKPIYIMIGDESPYDTITADHAKRYCTVQDGGDLKTSEVYKELMKKFSVHVILKPYSDEKPKGDKRGPISQRVYEKWVSLVGAERVWDLDDPSRVVDVIFGLLARETGKLGYFGEELKNRQTEEQCNTVMTSLRLDPQNLKDGAKPKAKAPAKPTGASLVNPGKKKKKS